MFGTAVENLVFKRFLEKASFGDIKEMLREQGWKTVRKFILEIEDENIKERLINEAKENFATQFDCKPEEVFYGDYQEIYIKDQVKTFPYSCVVGNVIISADIKDVSKLRVVIGDLYSNGIKSFENLERVYGIAEFDTGVARRVTINLPKLKMCRQLGLYNVIVEDVELSSANQIFIHNSKIGNLTTDYTLKNLKISPNSTINYLSIPIIEELHTYEKENGVEIKLINPKTKIIEVTPEPDYSVGLRIQNIRKEVEDAKKREIALIKQSNM